MEIPPVKNPPKILRALSSRNYRLYFSGQCVSLIGNWMTSTAALWLVYHLSGSPFYVGLIGFANQIPVLLLSPFAGVWVDRLDRRRLVLATQALAMLQSLALAALALTGHITVGWIVGLCLFQGFVNAIDWPLRQSLTIEMVEDRADLQNVIALNSVTFNLARMIGPVIAGFVIAGLGPGVCFLVDGVSFLAVLGALLAMRFAPHVPREEETHPLADLREGIHYAYTHDRIRTVLLLMPVIAMFGFAHSVLCPVFASDIFHGDARIYGLMLSFTGVGAVLAGLYLGMRTSPAGLGGVLVRGAVLGGVGLAAFAYSRSLPFSLFTLMMAGAGGVLCMAGGNTLVQTHVTDDKRGRVMSLFTMGQGMYPVGSLLIGIAATAFGAPLAMLACGLICLVAAQVFSRKWRQLAPVRS